jgi:hypothetical protein
VPTEASVPDSSRCGVNRNDVCCLLASKWCTSLLSPSSRWYCRVVDAVLCRSRRGRGWFLSTCSLSSRRSGGRTRRGPTRCTVSVSMDTEVRSVTHHRFGVRVVNGCVTRSATRTVSDRANSSVRNMVDVSLLSRGPRGSGSLQLVSVFVWLLGFWRRR